jgi:hypothetical protein
MSLNEKNKNWEKPKFKVGFRKLEFQGLKWNIYPILQRNMLIYDKKHQVKNLSLI